MKPTLLLLATLALAACGTSDPVRFRATVAPAASAAPAALSPREQTARKYAGIARDPASDQDMRGRLAMNGLAEPVFALPADLRKGMAAVTNPAVDPSQAATILMVSLLQTREAGEVLGRRCGQPFAAFAEELKALPPKERTRTVIARCRVTDVGSDAASSLLYASVLTSVAVEELLRASGGGSPSEIELARTAAQLQRAR